MSTRLIDCRNHSLAVFDGADRVGSLVERGGVFQAYDLAGVSHGVFDKVADAARAIPNLPDQQRALPERNGATGSDGATGPVALLVERGR